MIRLFVPHMLPGVLILGGGSWLVVGVVGLVRRILAVMDRMAVEEGQAVEPSALTSPFQLAATAVGVLIAMWLVAIGLRWLTYRVVIGQQHITARLLPRGRLAVPLTELRGVVLRQAAGVPQLRLVRTDGEVVVLPGWSLRARHPDGEVEPAGPALERLGPELGFKVKVVGLFGTSEEPGSRQNPSGER